MTSVPTIFSRFLNFLLKASYLFTVFPFVDQAGMVLLFDRSYADKFLFSGLFAHRRSDFCLPPSGREGDLSTKLRGGRSPACIKEFV